jgi:hypothetical protein
VFERLADLSTDGVETTRTTTADEVILWPPIKERGLHATHGGPQPDEDSREPPMTRVVPLASVHRRSGIRLDDRWQRPQRE